MVSKETFALQCAVNGVFVVGCEFLGGLWSFGFKVRFFVWGLFLLEAGGVKEWTSSRLVDMVELTDNF